MVQIRGQMVTGGLPGIKGNCQTPITVAGVDFPDIIELTDPQDRLALHKVDFHRDPASWNRLIPTWIRANHTSHRVEVVVEGMFETRLPIENLVDGRIHALRGFGDQARAPAQLLLKEVRDIKVIDQASSPK